jgi:hypothetical protein
MFSLGCCVSGLLVCIALAGVHEGVMGMIEMILSRV